MIGKWYKEKVLKGNQEGRKIGFPTVNLSPKQITGIIKEGVYISQIKFGNTFFDGLLFYGPRLVKHETKPVLEIYILNFNSEIYGEFIEFQIRDYIREVKSLQSMKELKKQINNDLSILFKKRLDK